MNLTPEQQNIVDRLNENNKSAYTVENAPPEVLQAVVNNMENPANLRMQAYDKLQELNTVHEEPVTNVDKISAGLKALNGGK